MSKQLSAQTFTFPGHMGQMPERDKGWSERVNHMTYTKRNNAMNRKKICCAYFDAAHDICELISLDFSMRLIIFKHLLK